MKPKVFLYEYILKNGMSAWLLSSPPLYIMAPNPRPTDMDLLCTKCDAEPVYHGTDKWGGGGEGEAQPQLCRARATRVAEHNQNITHCGILACACNNPTNLLLTLWLPYTILSFPEPLVHSYRTRHSQTSNSAPVLQHHS